MDAIRIVLNDKVSQIAALAAARWVHPDYPILVEWGDTNAIYLDRGAKAPFAETNDILRLIARHAIKLKLYGQSEIEANWVDHWLTFNQSFGLDVKASLLYLDKMLEPVTFLVGSKVTIADLAIFDTLQQFAKVHKLKERNIRRWAEFIITEPPVQYAIEVNKTSIFIETNPRPAAPAQPRPAAPAKPKPVERKQEGKFVDLPGAEMGKVVVRFPPEASGYLHIGHAKAALLNQFYQQAFQGKLIMRFDDTNPAKETIEFENVILEDLEMLEIKPDLFTHTSQYFDVMLGYCETLLKEGKAYVDDTEAEQMKLEREQKVESVHRSNSPEKNFEMWREMLNGTERGQKCCVRAKIDMASLNGCMRDPTIYRCKNEPHPRTGTQYKVYPTYDFACPIVDAIENVTHTLRTTEYHDRDDQFYWFIDALKLRKPYIWEYSRLNMTNTVLSKRKLTWFVNNGHVSGWDDPRFPTVRGILRRGMTVRGLKEFIIAQGSSKSVVFMEWDKIWAFNKKVIDPIAPRHTALAKSTVAVFVEGVEFEEEIVVPLHPKNPEVGNKLIFIGPNVVIEQEDAEQLVEGEFATFINWGNMLVDKLLRENGKVMAVYVTPHLDNRDFKKTLKLTWLCNQIGIEFPKVCCVSFQHIISKPVLAKNEDFKDFINHESRVEVALYGCPALMYCQKGDIIQLTRRGFWKVDTAYQHPSQFSGQPTPIVLFEIPDGHTKEKAVGGITKKAEATPKPAAQVASGGGKADDINQRIIVQGDLVRALKSSKAAKPALDAAVKGLLALKAEFKEATGKEWSPTGPAVVAAKPDSDLDAKITKQGDLVRDLKAKKASKSEVEGAVKALLALKADFKAATGQDWKPSTVSPTVVAAAPVATSGNDLNDKITKQGDLVRDLKSKKAAKPEVEAAVKCLLALKAEFKAATGQDWKPSAVAPTVVAAAPVASSGNDLNDKITKQGDLVRDLKSKKAAKPEVEAAVKSLLALKAEFKAATGQDWKPSAVAPTVVQTSPVASSGNDLNDKITKQGDLVRDLKTKKAAKPEVDAAVKSLLALKAEFKAATGQDWKPSAIPSPAVIAAAPVVPSATDLNDKITKQGDLVRDLKAKKASKPEIDAAVKSLLDLKAEYKMASGQDWKPLAAQPATVAPTASAGSDLNDKVSKQGDLVRDLKSKKASKNDIDAAVKTLLALKAEFKAATGQDWKPSAAATPPSKPAPVAAVVESTAPISAEASKIDSTIIVQGNLIRDLKAKKADKSEVEAAVKVLLGLKADFKAASGSDWQPANEPKKPKAKVEAKPKPKPAPKEAAPAGDEKSGVKKQTRLGLEASKWENLPDWYSQVITKSEMIEYYDVSGCYILRPLSISIWRSIQNFFQDEITKLGVKECYFPMFVSKAALEKEKDHIADFSPEVAWVTKSGDSDLAEPIAIRPTSETIMYPAFAKWIQSYRDLPLKLNQWSNVVRWEFKHPQPFLRTREFLWQEGHTAFATVKEAEAEVLDILDLYARIYEELLAIPVRRGRKSEKEKFAGGDYTTTVEAYVSASGRSIQGATSHHLGQNFSKMFDIIYEDPLTQEKKYVYQNSWGLTTRTIGVMVMVHGDDKGLIIPPRVAPVQAIVVPCGLTVNTTDAEREVLQKSCTDLESDLRAAGIRVEGDYRDNYSPGWKFNHWELKGTPIRIELGPKDIKSSQLVLVRRDTAEKLVVARDQAPGKVLEILDAIQKNLFAKAQKDFDEHLVMTRDWSEFCSNLEKKNVLCSPFCGVPDCEDLIKDNSAITEAVEPGAMLTGAKSLCIPFKQPADILPTDKCIHPACTRAPKFWTYFGRSY